MIRKALSPDLSELIFRILFSLIFLVLGAEHIFRDELIQRMMPEFLPLKRTISIGCGIILVGGGLMIMLGYRIHLAATILGLFLIAVTLAIHAPALLSAPLDLPDEWHWLWDLYQRSNFIKNLCLLGVCFFLLHHEPGKYRL